MKICLIPGDGIGPEIIAQAKKVLTALNLPIHFDEALLGGCAVDAYGSPFPEVTREKVTQADAILLGAVGGPKWDKHPRELRPEQGLLAIRAYLDLFANLRPVFLFPQLMDASPLKEQVVNGLDLVIVRELTGDVYFGQPRGQVLEGNQKIAYNTMRYSESEIRRIAKVAFEIASNRRKHICSVDKMNVLETSQLWRDIVTETAKEYPSVRLEHMLVDNAAMQLVREPKQFDVILTANLFGDILSDEASVLTGSIGMLPSASLSEGNKGLYEPSHGSAPDIAGKDKANPLATILSAALMLRYSFHLNKEAQRIESAVQTVLAQGYRTEDIAQKSTQVIGTDKMGDLVCNLL